VVVTAQLWRLAEAAVVGEEGHLFAHRVNTAGVVIGSIRRPDGACRANVGGHIFVSPTCTGSLVPRPSIARVACASARPSGTTNGATIDTIEAAVAPILARVC
jgi:hypothetical protein